MSREKASGLCSIHKASLTNQCKDKIIKVRHDPCPIANGKASGIFMEGHISSVMRTCLNSPMSTANFQELRWGNFFACQTGNSKFNFTRSFVTHPFSSPLEFTFETIDLCQTRPGSISIEHFADGHSSFLNPSVSLINFLCLKKIRLNFSKA